MMNLKEAFRYQNRLQSLLEDCRVILSNDRNTTRTECTYLRRKVMEGAENETVAEVAPSEYSGRINEIVGLMMYLLGERERLFAAIHDAKAGLDTDFDAEASLNSTRRSITAVLRRMADIRSSETTVPNGGYGYRFNADGNQVSYKCDVKRVTTIAFDRNMVRRYAAGLSRRSDEISSRLDQAIVNTAVEYDPPFDVNDTFADVFDFFTVNAGQPAE